MQTITEIRALLRERGIHPKHRLGQNFLHDQNQLRKLLNAADVSPGDVVLEIGPGTGTLTEELVGAGAEVIASEIDPDMAAIVRSRLEDRITLIEGDCLAGKHEVHPSVIAAVGDRPFLLVANLPYGIASPLIVNLLIDHLEACRGMFVTIQKEVAERLTADSGSKQYGALTIVTQALATVAAIGTVPPAAFWPQPEVMSAMVSIQPRVDLPELLATPEVRRRFSSFVTELFMKRRKQIGSVFGRDREYPGAIEASQRPESLSVNQVVSLFAMIASSTGGPTG